MTDFYVTDSLSREADKVPLSQLGAESSSDNQHSAPATSLLSIIGDEDSMIETFSLLDQNSDGLVSRHELSQAPYSSDANMRSTVNVLTDDFVDLVGMNEDFKWGESRWNQRGFSMNDIAVASKALGTEYSFDPLQDRYKRGFGYGTAAGAITGLVGSVPLAALAVMSGRFTTGRAMLFAAGLTAACGALGHLQTNWTARSPEELYRQRRRILES